MFPNSSSLSAWVSGEDWFADLGAEQKFGRRREWDFGQLQELPLTLPDQGKQRREKERERDWTELL